MIQEQTIRPVGPQKKSTGTGESTHLLTWQLLVLSVILPGGIPLDAVEFDHGPVLNITEENDFVNRTDRWYTQGAQISYLQADNDVPHWTHSLLEKVPTLG